VPQYFHFLSHKDLVADEGQYEQSLNVPVPRNGTLRPLSRNVIIAHLSVLWRSVLGLQSVPM
jgi:hypothetical protein